VWPAVNSYPIGEDRHNTLRDFAVQASPTSEGQFGEYPLVVFSDYGIYLVNQGQEIVYGAVVKISKLKANPGVLGVDEAIVFSTKDGIFVLSGRQTRELNRYLVANTMYDTQPITGIPASHLPHNDRAPDGILFIQNPVFGWDDQHREIIIANRAYDYHYRWSPQFEMMSCAEGAYQGFVVKQGQYRGYRNKDRAVPGGEIFLCLDVEAMDTDLPLSSVDYVSVYYKTNPQHLGFMELKKLIQTQAYFDLPRADPAPLRFYIYGGNIIKGIHPFKKLQESVVPTDTHAVHIIAGRTPLSARYIVFMMFGPVDPASAFHHITTDIKPVLPGRLR